MSRTTSPSTQKSYSLVRVCRVWHLQRSTILAAANQSRTSQSYRATRPPRAV